MNHCNNLGKTLFTIISLIDLTYYTHTRVNDVTFPKNLVMIFRTRRNIFVLLNQKMLCLGLQFPTNKVV